MRSAQPRATLAIAVTSGVVSPDALDAEAYALEARAAELHAKAARLRAARMTATSSEWIPSSRSPLAKKTTLALVRSGAIEAKKVRGRVYISTASLDAFMRQSDEAGAAEPPDGALRAELGLAS